jgi:hypothetical protein
VTPIPTLVRSVAIAIAPPLAAVVAKANTQRIETKSLKGVTLLVLIEEGSKCILAEKLQRNDGDQIRNNSRAKIF